MKSLTWTVRTSATADDDFEKIIAWTAQEFGPAQALRYADTLIDAIEALSRGPDIPGVKVRDDIAKGLFTLHAARSGRKARHFIVFRIGDHRGQPVIDILRILHDAMDLPRHIPSPVP